MNSRFYGLSGVPLAVGQTYRSIASAAGHAIAPVVVAGVMAPVIEFDDGDDLAGGFVFGDKIETFAREPVARDGGGPAVHARGWFQDGAHRDLCMDPGLG